MQRTLFILSFFLLLTIGRCENFTRKFLCFSNINCAYPNGECVANECVCSKGWMNEDQSGCTYELKSKLTAFLLSFFVGVFGVDWFYLCRGNAGYIIAGIVKLITFGGFGIWWLVDWIRLLANAFPDGHGVPLRDWND